MQLQRTKGRLSVSEESSTHLSIRLPLSSCSSRHYHLCRLFLDLSGRLCVMTTGSATCQQAKPYTFLPRHTLLPDHMLLTGHMLSDYLPLFWPHSTVTLYESVWPHAAVTLYEYVWTHATVTIYAPFWPHATVRL